MIELSLFDRESIDQILRGHGDWFSACLLRLIYADLGHRTIWAEHFPQHWRAVSLYEERTKHADRAPAKLYEPAIIRDSLWWLFAKGHGEFRQQLADAFPAEYRDWVKWTNSPNGSEADSLFLKHAIK
jgi:hypothetical protein